MCAGEKTNGICLPLMISWSRSGINIGFASVSASGRIAEGGWFCVDSALIVIVFLH